MTLLTLRQLRAIQRLGELGMNQPVKIYPRKSYARDPQHPYGDDIVEFKSTPVTTKGWLVTKPVERFEIGAGQVRTEATHQLRVPVGTRILPGDRVVVGGEEFAVTDATNEQSWPEWTVAYLRGYGG